MWYYNFVNKQDLETMKAQAEDSFKRLSEQRIGITDELTMLQGEHRLLVKLIDQLVAEESHGSEQSESDKSINKPEVSPRRKGVQPSQS
jgi:hypothetical protein